MRSENASRLLYTYSYEKTCLELRELWFLRRLQERVPRIKCDRTVLSRNLAEGTDENRENPSIRMSGLPAGIRTQHLPNASPNRYRYIDVLSFNRIQFVGSNIKCDVYLLM
jgi:hypothetical protein